eukprot:TRINITY_DN843_c0_g1_i1.p2 TRINITY_DN843_c0_g1~~TRINITY_DN843_c0_g1_i1.p2  ORF type:complete len:242 (-),score=16.33 TRINITY_DN843_c0_g1_i1:1487-2212(-)
MIPPLSVWVTSGMVSAAVDVATQYLEILGNCDHRVSAKAGLLPLRSPGPLARKNSVSAVTKYGQYVPSAEEQVAIDTESGALIEYCNCPKIDRGRTLRYGLVHLLYSTPLHILRLCALNALIPGPAGVGVALAKTAINELAFSPGDTAITLALVEMGNTGSARTVVDKIRSDFFPYQISKWGTHSICQIIVFTAATSFESQMYLGLGMKFFAEIILDHLANRHKGKAPVQLPAVSVDAIGD